MAEFKLDTSGVVRFDGGTLGVISWEGVGQRGGAFTQGYIEAMARELYERLLREGSTPDDAAKAVAFQNWSPETLARIIADCREGESYSTTIRGRWYNPNTAGGSCFWIDRQADFFKAEFPPLTAYIGEGGKVYLKD